MQGISDKTFRYLCILEQDNFLLEYNDSIDNDIKYGISLIGFNIDNLRDNQDSITLFSLDICHKDFNAVRSKKNKKYIPFFKDRFFRDNMFAIFTVELDTSGNSYQYLAYGNRPISRIKIKSISFQSYEAPLFNNAKTALNIVNKIPRQQSNEISHKYHGNFSLKVYTVGQGMCSLLCNGEIGYLLDAGAGTPVLRRNYKNGLKKNDLSKDVANLKKVYLILSHLDSDHFRIIRWDSKILSKITTIFIPSNLTWIDSNEKSILGKVKGIKKLSVTSPNLTLNTFRTEHHLNSTEKNDNELVTYLMLENKSILYPGDYTYDKIAKDSNNNIQSLQKLNYDLLIVPHHGDKESQYKIPNPKDDSSRAYFSAGNHASWCHPTPESLKEHALLGYKNLVKNKNSNIATIVTI
ncbi:hypothetical protein [Aeromonas dhakensis]|uniref:hypothetical protein n=1 Tax=Aeromonas dhakensis TaxID=196024 RepID=UPI003BA09336